MSTTKTRLECPACTYRMGWVPEDGHWICIGCGAALPWDNEFSAVALSIGYALMNKSFLEACDEIDVLKSQVENWKRRALRAEQAAEEGPSHA